MVVVTTRIPEPEAHLLDELARQSGLTRSAMIAQLLPSAVRERLNARFPHGIPSSEVAP